MTTASANLAVTKDGDAYNKLQRPDDYHVALSANHPPLVDNQKTAVPSAAKRQRNSHVAAGRKRQKMNGYSSRQKEGNYASRSHGPAADCGMRTMLPGLDNEDHFADGSIAEALAYLRGVRTEASSIPPLLTAPSSDRASAEDGSDLAEHAEFTSYGPKTVYEPAIFRDGVWIAIGTSSDQEEDVEEPYLHLKTTISAQQSCQRRLLQRFETLQHRLSTLNSMASQTRNSRNTGNLDEISWPKNKRGWSDLIEQTFPTISQLFLLGEETLFQAIQACTSSLSQSRIICRQKSCWIWSLLALAGDAGTLDHARISKIRDLGTQAGRLGVYLRQVDCSNHAQKVESGIVNHMQAKPCVTYNRHQHNRDKDVLTDLDQGCMNPCGSASPVGSTRGQSLTCAEQKDARRDRDEDEDDLHRLDLPMSTPGEEGEVHEDAANSELEQARARLLAQLGDRLVQPGNPSQLAASEREMLETQRTDDLMQPKDTFVSTGKGTSNTETVGELDLETLLSIDMILTIVAECYGQKDLLQFRDVW
ncbi:hypothetical protein ACN47E_000460 [Coniothyrium glycines]